jgi:hypothetical protein
VEDVVMIPALDFTLDEDEQPVLVEPNCDAWRHRDVVDKLGISDVVRSGSPSATHREFVPDEWLRVPKWLAKQMEANGEANPLKAGHRLDVERLRTLPDEMRRMTNHLVRSPRKTRRYRFANHESRRPSVEDLRRQLEHARVVEEWNYNSIHLHVDGIVEALIFGGAVGDANFVIGRADDTEGARSNFMPEVSPGVTVLGRPGKQSRLWMTRGTRSIQGLFVLPEDRHARSGARGTASEC